MSLSNEIRRLVTVTVRRTSGIARKKSVNLSKKQALPVEDPGLPSYRYTARDVTTGTLYLGYSDELSLACAEVFAEQIIEHLKKCGVKLGRATLALNSALKCLLCPMCVLLGLCYYTRRPAPP